jgi:malonyl CoA-acyl carrier protein transacylase
MAAPAEEAGTMAALACSRERAEGLVARAGGYVVVANVNSPAQVVVSGDADAVEEVVRLAEAEEVKATVLPVANAFHSERVAGAAEHLREHAPVPGALPAPSVQLLSGMTGGEVAAGTDLREHFADQVLAQVDFVSVVEELARRCDVLVEVGPGAVLSGLARATLGPGGISCLPVESSPGVDRDRNLVIAHLFARGVAIDWDELYAGRLVRPFVPAPELKFVENPLELPLQLPEDESPVQLGDGGGSRLAELTGVGESELADYLARRGRFLGDVIRADLRTGPADEPAPQPTAEPATAAGGAVEDRLVELVAEMTGFPPETIPLEARLLDDLNLDSIKAAELVTRAADERGVGEGLDIAPLANASLREVAGAIRAAAPADDRPAPMAALVEVVADATGFPPETLTPELRLLDDLNLDSIKAAEVVLETAGRLGVAEEAAPDPSTFANATLAEVATALAGAGAGAPAAARDAFEGRESWVRDFVVEDVEQPLGDERADVSGARLVVLGDADEGIREAFARAGADLHDVVSDDSVTHVVAVLPHESDLRTAIELLRAAVDAPAGARRTVVFVERGGELGAAAFAASVHHERPDLRVRVVEVDPALEPRAVADCVLAELATPDAFAAARYDAGLTRRVRCPRVEDPLGHEPRGIHWSPKDVILATGGGKGITAECALALAGTTGASFALVGSSPEGDEVAATLERFQQAGRRARYYRCDVSDADAVGSLVEQVRGELGEITGVLHGAGANTPRRVEQTSADDAAAEAAPKVLGALNLARALADRPPKLLVGFSSIIGVTGMPGNAWYGFANEALDRILRRFGDEHPETAVLSLAYSIWGEVGMGAKLGSSEHLGRMGIAAIPTGEGVRRFLRLVERRPSDPHVVVAARLRGLDTWNPDRPPLPRASRFLEDVLHVEPGVEVVARARLTLDRDSYLRDHVYKGSHLLPTVFGLEAMAQAAAYAAGETAFGAVRIEDVLLERPIAVDPGTGAEVEIRAEVLEGAERRVRASIGTAKTGFSVDHFSATFVLGAEPEPVREEIELPPEPLPIRPEEDLYGRLLFQGPQFRRIRAVHRLDAGECVLVAEEREPDDPYLLGDPFFRDALLHGAQLVVPQSLCLPVGVASIEIRPAEGVGARVVRVVNEGRTGDFENAQVVATDEGGRVLARLRGYRLRILERLEENPSAEAIADPSRRDAALLRDELERRAAALGVQVPAPAFAYTDDLHALSADERHELERPIFGEAVARFLANGGGAP